MEHILNCLWFIQKHALINQIVWKFKLVKKKKIHVVIN